MLNDSKIYLITFMENGREFVSHGIGDYTLKTYILSLDSLLHFKPKRDFEGWYIDGPAVTEVNVRFILRTNGQWEESYTSMTAADLARICSDYDDMYAVVVDDRQGIYYCGRADLVDLYRAKGKTALPFPDLERRLFHDLASFGAPAPLT